MCLIYKYINDIKLPYEYLELDGIRVIIPNDADNNFVSGNIYILPDENGELYLLMSKDNYLKLQGRNEIIKFYKEYLLGLVDMKKENL